jgi:ApbE superfamily uncharacterized protein (UPF0280 family)
LRIGVDRESYTEDLTSFCRKKVLALRSDLENYIDKCPQFQSSFQPLEVLPASAEIIRCMAKAARLANVGPMAAVAGAIAELLGEELSGYCKDIIIENGGDIYLKSRTKRIITIFAGKTPFSNQIGLEIDANEFPLGLCTSSGTIGQGISLGKADAVIIKAKTASLADAVATAAANRIKSTEDLKLAIEFANKIKGVTGVIAIKDSKLAAWGKIKIIKLR